MARARGQTAGVPHGPPSFPTLVPAHMRKTTRCDNNLAAMALPRARRRSSSPPRQHVSPPARRRESRSAPILEAAREAQPCFPPTCTRHDVSTEWAQEDPTHKPTRPDGGHAPESSGSNTSQESDAWRAYYLAMARGVRARRASAAPERAAASARDAPSAATQPASAPVHPWRCSLVGQHSGSFRWQADLFEALTAEQPGQALSECVTAQLVLPERMHVRIPLIASTKRDTQGEQLLCLRRPGTESCALEPFHVSGISLSRHWGLMSSMDRVVELSVPGDETLGNVLLVLDSYDSMQRLARMVLGREIPDSTQQAIDGH